MAIDIHSATWADVQQFCDERAASARKTLESAGCDQRVADQCRGIIAVLSELQRLPNKETPPVITSVDY